MKNIKKLLALVLVVIMMGSFIACNNENESNENKKDQTTQSSDEENNKNTSNSQNSEDENFNSEGYPIVDEQIEISFLTVQWPPHPADWDEMEIIQKVEKLTNIDMVFEVIPNASYTEKKNLYLASGDLPDVIFYGVTATEMVDQGSEGQILALNDLIDEYAPNTKEVFEASPIYKKSITAPDGNIYGFAAIEDYPHRQFINTYFMSQKWLDNVGMEVPTTTDEFYDVLKAFKANDANGNGDPDDEVPFTIEPDRVAAFCSPWGITADFYIDNDDEISAGFIEDGYKEGIRYLNKLFDEGLIHNEMFTLSAAHSIGKLEGNILGSCVRATISQVMGAYVDDYIYFGPLEGPTGIKTISYQNVPVNIGKFVISAKNPYPRETVRLADYFMSAQGSFETQLGVQGINWEYNKDGVVELLPTPEGISYGVFRNGNAPGGAGIGALGFEGREVVPSETNEYVTEFIIENYIPVVTKTAMPNMIYSLEDTDKIAELQPTIETYRDEMKANFITGEKDIDDNWDEYLKTLEDMGLEDLLKVYTDRYKLFIQ